MRNELLAIDDAEPQVSILRLIAAEALRRGHVMAVEP
jgi:hypothetical protein